MRNIANVVYDEEKYLSHPCANIELMIQPREKGLGVGSVRRSFPVKEQEMVGPLNLFEWEILHRDSLGSLQAFQLCDINLVITGGGIIHSGCDRPEVREVHHRFQGLQLWLALPRKDQEIDSEFYHYSSNDIPQSKVSGVSVHVIMGSAFGTTSSVKVFSETLFIKAHLQPG